MYIPMTEMINIIKELSTGAYSKCSLALDSKNNYIVVKKSINTTLYEGLKYFELRELYCLLKLKNHPNIINLLDVYYDNDLEINLVLEYVPTTLKDFIESNNFETRQKYFLPFLTQLLSAILYIHHNGITHTDIKSKNILIDFKLKSKFFKLVVIDFGSSTVKNLTENYSIVTTAKNRAPEIFNYDGIYTDKIDMWSLGMVIYYYLFGATYINERDEEIEEKISVINNHIEKNISSYKIKQLLLSLLDIDPSTRGSIHETVTLCENLFNIKIPKYMNSSVQQSSLITSNIIKDKLLHLNNYIQRNLSYIDFKSFDKCSSIIDKYKLHTGLIDKDIKNEHLIIAWFLYYQFVHTDVDYTLLDLLPFFNFYTKGNYSITSLLKKIIDFMISCNYDFI
jgi:serine/threonine protein kinase